MSITTIKLDPPVECRRTPPLVLVVAGSDNSGGAGIEADLKTLTAHSVYGLTCIGAITSQNTQKVEGFDATSDKRVQLIFDLNFDDFGDTIKVVKTGMLTGATVKALHQYLPKMPSTKLLVDPVMIATTGGKLFDDEAMQLAINSVMKQAYLITPNFPEAKALASLTNVTFDEVDSQQTFIDLARKLRQRLGCENLFVKGGHIPWGSTITDVLVTADDGVVVYESEYMDTDDTHGTGCTLASAIAANLAKDIDLDQAIANSIGYVHQAMVSGTKLGKGNGPLYHYIKPPVVKLVAPVKPLALNQPAYDYFKAQAGDLWTQYTHHPFLKKLATNQLPGHQFTYYLTQDYFYLINYAQVHGLAAARAPNEEQVFAQAFIMNNIGEEIRRHKHKMKETYGLDYANNTIPRGKACREYCDYLLHVGENFDFALIKIAVAPCLHGYYEAGEYARLVAVLDLAPVFKDWIGDYTSDWYREAHEQGQQVLDDIAKLVTSEARLAEMVQMFNRVTQLEINFWSECLEIDN